jgi:hypothetical protein
LHRPIFSEQENFALLCATVYIVRTALFAAAGLLAVGVLSAPPVAADPEPVDPAVVECNEPSCVPGIQPGAVLGAPCTNTTYYVFGVTDWGRVVFCGSPRRYDPRWFRSTELRGIKIEGSSCSARDGEMAQAPDGLFLSCDARNGASTWTRGDL